MLCSNRLSSLSDLDPLVSLSPSLRTLSLLHNPCAKLADYRAYVIHLLPQLHSLDFAKVKPKVSRDRGRQDTHVPHPLHYCAAVRMRSVQS
jgi:hypothetical protein